MDFNELAKKAVDKMDLFSNSWRNGTFGGVDEMVVDEFSLHHSSKLAAITSIMIIDLI